MFFFVWVGTMSYGLLKRAKLDENARKDAAKQIEELEKNVANLDEVE